MKHSLSLLCLVITGSLFQTHNATAEYLLEHNPTPIELNSFSVSDEAYQVAGVYHIVDYSKKMESFFGKRINDDGKNVNGKNCARYGFVDSCGEGQDGKIVHPMVGLTCYTECKAKDKTCSDLGMLSSCPAHYKPSGENKTPGGITCYESCMCDSDYYKYTEKSCQNQSNNKKAGGESCNTAVDYIYPGIYESDGLGDNWRYTECVCTDEYKLKSCPDGCNCSSCSDNSTKYKIDNAQESEGWSWTSGQTTCSATPCPAGYTAGITECSDSQKYTYSSNGKSGGKVCGKCTVIIDDTCPDGYSKTLCRTGQTETTTTTAAGNTCYKCEDPAPTPSASGYIKLAVRAPSAGSKLEFTLKGSGYTINWGEGTPNSESSHTYTSAGDYDVTMSGGITDLIAKDSEVAITKLYTLDLSTIKKAKFSDNCTELTGEIPNFPPSLTDGSNMFAYCAGLEGEIPELPASLEDGSYMFTGAYGFEKMVTKLPANLKKANYMFEGLFWLDSELPEFPAGLVEAEHMFDGCDMLYGSIPALPKSLKNGNYMFYATPLTGDVPELPNSLEYANYMFAGTELDGNMAEKLPSSLKEAAGMFVDLEYIVGNLPELPNSLEIGERMFKGCASLEGNIIKLPSSLTNGDSMFLGCEGLEGEIPQLPSGLIDGSFMFAGCINLTGDIPELPNSLKRANYMFSSCVKFDGEASFGATCKEFADSGLNGQMVTKLPLSLTQASGMFSGLQDLTGEIPPQLTDLKLENGDYMFFGCTGLESDELPKLPDSLTSARYMFSGLPNLKGNISSLPPKLADGSHMFEGCRRLIGYFPTIPSTLKDGSYMFSGCIGLGGKVPDLSSTKLVNANGMFKDCGRLYFNFGANLPNTLKYANEMFSGSGDDLQWLPGLPDSLEEANYMFEGCQLLPNGGIGVQWFAPKSLVTARGMFKNCKNLGELRDYTFNVNKNSSGITETSNTVKLKDGGEMFAGCTDLGGYLPVLPSTLEKADHMFEGCEKLTMRPDGSYAPKIDFPSNLKDASYMFNGCSALRASLPYEKPASLTQCTKMLTGSGIPLTWYDNLGRQLCQ